MLILATEKQAKKAFLSYSLIRYGRCTIGAKLIILVLRCKYIKSAASITDNKQPVSQQMFSNATPNYALL
ncbi:MAG: hypothetical protein DID92_2727745006 [Candidatus Nitrotoga sp. SPKER]|nr:MAG: hypothetical protein DID92_2727745006 [Candidatus Nitrotoga sp. SPKER]